MGKLVTFFMFHIHAIGNIMQ